MVLFPPQSGHTHRPVAYVCPDQGVVSNKGLQTGTDKYWTKYSSCELPVTYADISLTPKQESMLGDSKAQEGEKKYEAYFISEWIYVLIQT